MKINHYANKDKALVKAGSFLNQVFNQFKKFKILFMSSGGSSLGILDKIDTGLINKNFTITVLDERFSRNPKINNFSQLMQTDFFKGVKKGGANFIDTRVKRNDSLEDFSNQFEEKIKKWKKRYSRGKVIATCGVGIDGHIAGIMPFPGNQEKFYNLFDQKNKWVVGYDSKNTYPLRVTATLSFLRLIDCSVVYVVGIKKTQALKKIVKRNGFFHETPSRILKEMKNVTIFTNINI